MSISQLLQSNSYNLNASTLSIKNTILDSQGTPYILVLPNDNNLGPLSVLVVDSIVGNNVFLRWSVPIDPPQQPFNYIECNTLKANVDVISKSLTIDNLSGNSTQLVYNGTSDIVYDLPTTLPLQDSILKSDVNGNLEWTEQPIIPQPYVPLRHWFIPFSFVNLTSSKPSDTRQTLIGQLESGMYYNVFFNFNIRKNNPTGTINLSYDLQFGSIANKYSVSFSNVLLPITVGGSTIPDQTDYYKTNNFQIRAPSTGDLNTTVDASWSTDITGAGDITINNITIVISPINYNQR